MSLLTLRLVAPRAPLNATNLDRRESFVVTLAINAVMRYCGAGVGRSCPGPWFEASVSEQLSLSGPLNEHYCLFLPPDDRVGNSLSSPAARARATAAIGETPV